MYELLEEGHTYELCRAGDYWSEEDVEFFKHNLHLEDSLLARHMKRSKTAIISRRRSEDPFVVSAAWLKILHESKKIDALHQAKKTAKEEAYLAELEHEILTPDCRNAARRS